jgi:hypothetical protein
MPVLRHLSSRQAERGTPTANGKLTERVPPRAAETEESEMKNMILAAFAALGIVLGTTSLVTQANAAAPQTNYQAGQAGGEG